MSLEGTKTHENLKSAFAGESQANRRYLYFARQADIEGYPEAAGVFKNTADGETGHAFGHDFAHSALLSPELILPGGCQRAAAFP